MSVEPQWFVGDLNPSITEQVTINGAPVDVSAATVKFRMRAAGSNALKVDAAATPVDAPNGKVRYDWQAADVDTEGFFLVWWVVTQGGKSQTVNEAVIEFRRHGATAGTMPSIYVEPEVLKDMLDAQGTRYMDAAVKLACGSISRAIDLTTKRRFFPDVDATSVRLYSPQRLKFLQIDDLITLTSVQADRTGDTVFEETWSVGTDFVLGPYNAPYQLPVRPYEWIECRKLRGRWFPVQVEQSVKVTGQFGWLACPQEIQAAAVIMAEKMVKRMREAPFGIIAIGGPETGIAMRIAKTDPDVYPILCEYQRGAPWL